MTTFDTDQDIRIDTQTVAAGWASSPLGQPDGDLGLDFTEAAPAVAPTEAIAPEAIAPEAIAPEAEERRPVSRHAILAAALALGVGAGAAITLMAVDFTPDGPTVIEPGAGSTPGHAVVITNTGEAPTSAAPAPAPANVPELFEVSTPPAAPSGPTVDVPAPSQPAPPADAGQPAEPPQDAPQDGPQDGPQDNLPPIPPHPPLPPTGPDDVVNPGPPAPPTSDIPDVKLPPPPMWDPAPSDDLPISN